MRHAALEVKCLELCGSRLGELFCLLRIGDAAVWFFWTMILFFPWRMTQTWFWRSKGADTIASAKPSSTGLGLPS